MDYSFIIRKATIEDTDALHEILRQAFTEYANVAGLNGHIDALKETQDDLRKAILDKTIFIAIIDEQPVGTVRVETLDDGSAYISRFGVSSSHRNIGIGKALMNVVDKYILSENVKKVFLHTASRYGDLMRFYYGRGFFVCEVSTDRGYYRVKMVKEY